MIRKIIMLCVLVLTISSFSEEKEPIIPILPLLPSIPTNSETSGNPIPIEVKTVVMKMETEIKVPLEIISDIEIQAMVIDEQEVVVPFEIELNKEPEKKDYYKLNYSETDIDIDNDGKVDTHIYSNKFLNSKIEKDNKVVIEGKNISKEGYHEKVVYLTIDILD